MKIVDQDGRLFGKISVIDLLVIAVVLVMAAALYVKNVRLAAIREEEPPELPQQTITLQIRVNSLRNYIYQAIHVGDEVRDWDYSSGDEPVGVITDIQVLSDPGTALVGLADGTADMIEIEDTVDLLITVEGTGGVDGRNYLINNVYNVGVNSNRNYYTLLSQFTGTVADVR